MAIHRADLLAASQICTMCARAASTRDAALHFIRCVTGVGLECRVGRFPQIESPSATPRTLVDDQSMRLR